LDSASVAQKVKEVWGSRNNHSEAKNAS